MPTVGATHHDDLANAVQVEASDALAQRRQQVADALDAAPEGRFRTEQDNLAEVRQHLGQDVDGSTRAAVDTFFDRQAARLDVLQQGELVLGAALTRAESMDALGAGLTALRDLREGEQWRLADDRQALGAALAVEDATSRDALVAALSQRQEDALRALPDLLDAVGVDIALAEGPREPWTAEEAADRQAGGLQSEKVAAAWPEAGDDLVDMTKAPRTADEIDRDERHKRGNLGERTAAEALAADGYTILDYKPDLWGTTAPGIDILAMKDDTLYLLDNKALSRSGDVSSVSALTTSLDDRPDRDGNLTRTRDLLTEMAADPRRSEAEFDLVSRALAALDEGRYELTVTNANLTRDDRILDGVSDSLKAKDVGFLSVLQSSDDLTAEEES